MKKPHYLFSSGRLRRQHNTLALERATGERTPDDSPADGPEWTNDGMPSVEPDGKKVPFAVETVDSLYVFGEVDINTKLITFLGQQGIPAFFFDYYGYYTATLYPREAQLSGRLHIEQARHYLSPKRRLVLARAFVEAALFNIERVIKYYQPRLDGAAKLAVQTTLADLIRDRDALPLTTDILTLMAVEGRIRNRYYQLWPYFLGPDITAKFPFTKRERQPPSNELNALISFGNSLCYTTVLRQIYRTALDPTIAFLHEPGDRRFSLSLDLAEVFKTATRGSDDFPAVENRRDSAQTFFGASGRLLPDRSGPQNRGGALGRTTEPNRSAPDAQQTRIVRPAHSVRVLQARSPPLRPRRRTVSGTTYVVVGPAPNGV